jgi:hypothetical protein
VLEIAIGERAALADRLLDRAHHLRVLPRPQPPPGAMRRQAVHDAAPAREVLHGNEARHVREVLEQHAAPVDQAVERGAIERAEPAPGGEVVARSTTLIESIWMPPVSAAKPASERAVSFCARGRSRCWRSMKSAATARSG